MGGGDKPAGGPGSGPAQPFTAPGPALLDNHDPEEQAYRKEQRRLKRELRARMMGVLVEVAEDKAQPGAARSASADRVLDRIDGKPTQKTVLTGNDDGPVKIEAVRRVIIDPKAAGTPDGHNAEPSDC